MIQTPTYATAGEMFRAEAEAAREIGRAFSTPERARTGVPAQNRQRLLTDQLSILAMDQMTPEVINIFTVRCLHRDAERVAQTLIIQELADRA